MPLLENPRHEAFALARARGAFLDDAYEDAGFTPGNGRASRLAARPEVAERISELRAVQSTVGDAGAHAVITALLDLAQVGKDLTTAAGVKEARLALLDASRLRDELALARAIERVKSRTF